MDKKISVNTKEYLALAVVVIGVYVGFKYLSPLVTPFLFAFAIISLIHPMLDILQKKLHIKKGLLTAGILFLLCVTAGLLLWSLMVFLFHELGGLLGQTDLFEQKFCLFIRGCCQGLEEKFGLAADGIENLIMERVNIFIQNFEIQVVPKIMNESIGYVKNIVSVGGFAAIMIIAAVLLAKDYAHMMEKVQNHRDLSSIVEIGRKIFHHVGTFIKAQLIILCIISLICVTVLFLSGIEGGFFFGLLIGFMDTLPFIGTGLVLLPLSFWQILNGDYTRAVICIVLYVICVLTREFLEPKLIGEKMGIYPVAILFSVYAGVKLFGIFGIIKGPLALITIYELYRYIKELGLTKVSS